MLLINSSVTTPAWHFEETKMAMLVSILAEFYKFVDEISLRENNYVSKQSLSGIFSFTEKKKMGS